MKQLIIFVLLVVAVAFGAAMFVREDRPSPPPQSAEMSHSHPTQDAGMGYISGKVIETMDAGGYTYVHVDAEGGHVWAAGPETVIEVGSVVSFAPGMTMSDFHSESLDRTFDEILFVSEIVSGEGHNPIPGHAQPGSDHPRVGSTGYDAESTDFAGIEVPSNGKTIAALYAEKSDLAGKDVVVRGRVMKVTANVMGKNWLHVMDGTGDGGANDLTVTTTSVVNVGDIVLIRGPLGVDKDFGMGYSYDIIIEDATVSVESIQ